MSDGLNVKKRRLPHWSLRGATYFITWSLIEGVSPLSPDERTIVENAILHFNETRYKLLAYVVMDDHVHVIVRPLADYSVGKIAHTWKSFSANGINKLRNRQGALWQRDRFDRIIRDEKELMQKMEYLVSNPTRRWPEDEDYLWVKWFADG